MNGLLAVTVALITVAAFGRFFTARFTNWDDPGTIWANPHLNPPTWAALKLYWTTLGEKTPGQLYTPVTYTVWLALAAVSDTVFGTAPDADGVRLSPALFHGANVLLHAAAAGLAFLLLRRLSGHRWLAVAGALLFALHPVQVEPVGWASGTKDVLCGLFSIAALLAYVRAVQLSEPTAGLAASAGGGSPTGPGVPLPAEAASRAVVGGRTRRRLRYLFATSLFLLAMLSKPTALMVPPMAFAVDVLLLGRPWRRAMRWLWPWAVLMVPCVLWTRAAQPAPWASPVPAWTRPLVATDAVAFYLCKVAWPVHLCVDYGRRPGVVVASGVVYSSWLLPAAVAAALAWRWPRSRPAVAAAVLFVLPLVPILGLVPFDFQFYSTVADHYLYLPLLGAAVAATWALARMPARPAAWGASVVLVALAVRTVVQTPTWHDSVALFEDALAVNPRSFAACDQLGYAEGQRARRLRGGRPAVPPTDPAYAQWRAGLERALGWYERSLQLYDGYVPSLVNIAINAGQLGQHDRQRAALRRVAELQPTLPAGLRADPPELAKRMVAAGDPAGAVAYLDGVLRADPTDMTAVYVRNQALAAMRR